VKTIGKLLFLKPKAYQRIGKGGVRQETERVFAKGLIVCL